MLELGKKAKDKITGFEGIIIGKCEYLTGCDQYGLTPEAKDGEVKNTQWFDAGRIEVTGDGITLTEVSDSLPGGPNRDCPK